MSHVDIAFIGGRGFRSRYGGVENAIREIVGELARLDTVSERGLRIAVCGVSDPVADGSYTCPENVKIISSPLWLYQKFGQYGLTCGGILALIFLHRPKVAVVFASGPCVFVPLLRLFGIQVVSSLRAVDSARDKWGRFNCWLLQAGEYCAWRFSSVFTVNSLEMIARYQRRRADVVFLPNGARPAIGGSKQTLHGLSLQSNEYFLFAARLDPVKRLHLLLEAHANLDESVRLPLVVAGGHCKSENYKASLSRYKGAKVIFLGHVSDRVLAPLMRHCRAFVLPSVLEGMSNSLLSAMATGRAVLASDIRANSDVLQHDDAVFKTDNMAALERGLARLAEDIDFADQLGRQLVERSRRNHSWEYTARMLYRQIEPYLDLAFIDNGAPSV